MSSVPRKALSAKNVPPTLELEHTLLQPEVSLVIGCDEVGRGAIAGPVAVGMAACSRASGRIPEGLRDSKLLTEKRREAVYPATAEWALFRAVGYASAREVDTLGISACLGLAGKRALITMYEAGATVGSSIVLLDGSHDWLSPALSSPLRVHTRVGADRDCASVAAASVLAKVERDRLMKALDERMPGYGWGSNKGYGSAQHYRAISDHGTTEYHRVSWLRGTGSTTD
ncbi:ribonuclease HII [Lysinibacter sp. HNR]|uniref:ribonuclease HII n=1 Tax=Lysinibacter sp. HNR TaxID=3031408 RepID=UPI002435B1B6|nr:ribonuclease HII [Lysinibacter sp. HNR]WGD38418.1 ribonuclease HII [Lysinibacter sp. HNR]